MQTLIGYLQSYGASAGLLAALLLVLFLHYVLFAVLRRFAARTSSVVDDSLVKYCRAPSLIVVLLLALLLAFPLVGMPRRAAVFVRHMAGLLLILSVAWLLIRGTYVLRDFLFSQYKLDVKDNLAARKVHTQIRLLIRIAVAVIIVLALGAALMTFEQVRQLGTSILASAGLVGIVVGLAAQRTLGMIIAGLQLAITQPIRIDDVVIVENEWGRIEEITLTYVVVRIWDLRRLVLPVTYFIERPFQNWTRVTADILGTVFLYVDYTVPVEKIRAELRRILEASELWDKKVEGLQVTNMTERTVELRALMSAADASMAWSLRCEVREKLLAFVQREFPDGLPRLRVESGQSAQSPAST